MRRLQISDKHTSQRRRLRVRSSIRTFKIQNEILCNDYYRSEIRNDTKVIVREYSLLIRCLSSIKQWLQSNNSVQE